VLDGNHRIEIGRDGGAADVRYGYTAAKTYEKSVEMTHGQPLATMLWAFVEGPPAGPTPGCTVWEYTTAGASQTLYFPIDLPHGAELINVGFRFGGNNGIAGNPMTAAMYKVNLSGTPSLVHANATRNNFDPYTDGGGAVPGIMTWNDYFPAYTPFAVFIDNRTYRYNVRILSGADAAGVLLEVVTVVCYFNMYDLNYG